MPPERTKPTKTTRTHLENKERAYIAASRRSDRSLEARVESARKASEIHKQRTGKALRVTEADVENEEMYEEEDGDLATMRNRVAQRQFQAQSLGGFENRLRNFIDVKMAWGDYIGTLAHANNGMNPSMYGAANGFGGQMMAGGMFSPQYMSTVNPSAYHPYGSPDDVYQQKMAAQFAGHNPSQYMPISHPPRSLQAPDPRVFANMQNMAAVGMTPRWAMAQQQPPMGQFGNFNPSMFMRPGMPPTVEAVRAVEGQQRDILTQRAAEMARAKVQMNQMKTLNSAAPPGTTEVKPLTPAATPVATTPSDAPIKSESDSQSTLIKDNAATPSTEAPLKSVDTKPSQIALKTVNTPASYIGPFTSELPAEAQQFDLADLSSDQFPEAMLYRSFPLSEEFNVHHQDDIVSSATSMHAPVAFSDPFAPGASTSSTEHDSFGWFTGHEGPQGEVDFESFLAGANDEVLA